MQSTVVLLCTAVIGAALTDFLVPSRAKGARSVAPNTVVAMTTRLLVNRPQAFVKLPTRALTGVVVKRPCQLQPMKLVSQMAVHVFAPSQEGRG